MGSITDLIADMRSGVLNIVLEENGQAVGSGTGFLIEQGVVTASHVLRKYPFDTARLRFADMDADEGIRLSSDDLLSIVGPESLKDDCDFAIIQLNEPEFKNRHRAKLSAPDASIVGEKVVALGYPFESSHLTAHIGYVSARYPSGPAMLLQLDASINPSNSGGPVITTVNESAVVGIVTRNLTGLAKDFDTLRTALQTNIEQLRKVAVARSGSTVRIGGIDPLDATARTFALMAVLAKNLERSANVGIGFAHSSEHIIEALKNS